MIPLLCWRDFQLDLEFFMQAFWLLIRCAFNQNMSTNYLLIPFFEMAPALESQN